VRSLPWPRLATLAAQVKLRLPIHIFAMPVKAPQRRALVEYEMVASPVALASPIDEVKKKQFRLISASRDRLGANGFVVSRTMVWVCTVHARYIGFHSPNERCGHDCCCVENHRCCVCLSRWVSLEGQTD